MIARIVRRTAVGIAAALALTAAAVDPKDSIPTTTDEARKLALPKTAEDHAGMAKSYEEKAAAWRQEAAYHREMAVAYKNFHPTIKGEMSKPDVVKMEKHCMAIVKDAEKLAADAEWSAKYHHERAKPAGQGNGRPGEVVAAGAFRRSSGSRGRSSSRP